MKDYIVITSISHGQPTGKEMQIPNSSPIYHELIHLLEEFKKSAGTGTDFSFRYPPTGLQITMPDGTIYEIFLYLLTTDKLQKGWMGNINLEEKVANLTEQFNQSVS